MVVDLISIVTNQPATSFDHQLGSIELPDSVAGHLDTARKLREQAARAQHDAAEEVRKAARELSEDGVPLRDIGRLIELLGWKPGRSGPGRNPSGLSVEGCTFKPVGR